MLTEAVPPDGAPTWRATLSGSATSAAAAPSRRAVLAASAAALPLLLTACKGVQALGTPPPPPRDIVALRAAISAEALMVTRYAAALGRVRRELQPTVPPAGATLLSALAAVHAEHAAHLAQLRSRLIQPAGSAPAPSPSASQSPAPEPTGSPDDAVAAEVTALAVAEQAASDRLIGQLAGLPPSLAQLFASIAASEATHVPYLQAARRAR